MDGTELDSKWATKRLSNSNGRSVWIGCYHSGQWICWTPLQYRYWCVCGLVTYLMLLFRSKRTQIDDTLDVWAAHGMGGVTGAILTRVC